MGLAENKLAFADFPVGSEARADYLIGSPVYEGFLALFHDTSPIHIDTAFAQARGFNGCVMHGAILNGFLSHFIGVRFPGRNSLLLTVDIRYLAPSFLGDKIEIRAEVEQRVESQRILVLAILFQNETQNQAVARARVQVKVEDEIQGAVK